MRERVEQQIDAAFEPPIDERPDISERQLAWYRKTQPDSTDDG